jgi:hypothetical protein
MLARDRLLEVLANPYTRRLTITEICKKANVSRQRLHVLCRDPVFQAKFKKLLAANITSGVYQALNSCIKQACAGSFLHQKLLFEMAGLYRYRASVDIGLDVRAEVQGQFTYEHFLNAVKAISPEQKYIDVETRKVPVETKQLLEPLQEKEPVEDNTEKSEKSES